MIMPRVSVVIPTFNYADVLKRAVESVLPQLEGIHELLIVDDGSTDDTRSVVNRLLELYPDEFRYVAKENGGAASARNMGIRQAAGDYLLFLDADDELLPGALQALTDHIDRNPETRFVLAGHHTVDDGQRIREFLPGVVPEDPVERLRDYLLEKKISISHGACAMHREVFGKSAYPEAFRNAEDIPVFAQALANFPCSVLSRPLALIHKHDNSLRHQFTYAKAGGVALVDEIFSPSRLSAPFQVLKPAFYVQRCLSLFRSAYLAGDVPAARHFFYEALKRDWRVLLKWSYSRKAFRVWLGV